MIRPRSKGRETPSERAPAPTDNSDTLTPAGRRRWWGLVFISLGVAMIIVDATIVNVAIPSIIDDLGVTSTGAQWIQEVYTLVFAALLLSVGRIADSTGRRRLFVIGAGVFGAASILAATSATGGILIGSRVLQGIGGAMMLPTSLSLLNAEFRGKERGIAFAIWGSTIGGMAAIGPLLGGWLTTSLSWRYAFGINIPITVAVVVGTVLCVRESSDKARRGIDALGALLSVIGFAGIVFGLIEGRHYGWWALTTPFRLGGIGWNSGLSPVPAAIAIGAATLVAFVAVQRARNRRGASAALDLNLFRIASFRNGNIASSIVSLGEFGLLFALPLWFQNVQGYTAFEAGLALLPLAVGSFAASGLTTWLVAHLPAVSIVRIGIAAELAGVAGIGLVVRTGGAWWETVPPLFVYGLGVGLATAQLTGVVLADVPVQQSGQGSATQSTSRQLGSALGIAILGTVLFAGLGGILSGKLDSTDLPAAEQTKLVTAVTSSAGAAIPGLAESPLTAHVALLARDAFTESVRYTAFTAAGFLAAGLLATRTLSPGKRREDGAEI
ncbi:MAG TPA: MFS transporter [Mycobacterium sp.]